MERRSGAQVTDSVRPSRDGSLSESAKAVVLRGPALVADGALYREDRRLLEPWLGAG